MLTNGRSVMDSNKIKNLAAGVRAALREEASLRLDAVLALGMSDSFAGFYGTGLA